MKTTEALQKLQEQIDLLTVMKKHIESLESENGFMNRVLKQALLSNDGVIYVDPSKKDAADQHHGEFEFGNGKICFTGSKHSIFHKQ